MAQKSKTGTREWAETTLNIAQGCEHGCRYCYARQMLVERFGKISAEDWKTTRVNQAVVDAVYGRKLGTIMIPSSHDIIPSIINEFCCVLRKLLDAGNEVLIVSKPHLECVRLICNGFTEHADRILFRFTIGSTNNRVLKFWEPGAPDFEERLECLRYAYGCGYRTSVSCEPYLDYHPGLVFQMCKRWVTDSFWIGKLRHFNSRVKLDDATAEEIAEFVEPLKQAQHDLFVKSMYLMLKDEPLVWWKDSVREVIGL